MSCDCSRRYDCQAYLYGYAGDEDEYYKLLRYVCSDIASESPKYDYNFRYIKPEMMKELNTFFEKESDEFYYYEDILIYEKDSDYINAEILNEIKDYFPMPKFRPYADCEKEFVSQLFIDDTYVSPSKGHFVSGFVITTHCSHLAPAYPNLISEAMTDKPNPCIQMFNDFINDALDLENTSLEVCAYGRFISS